MRCVHHPFQPAPLPVVRGFRLVQVMKPVVVTRVAAQIRPVPRSALQLHLVQLQVGRLVIGTRPATRITGPEPPRRGQHQQHQKSHRAGLYPALTAHAAPRQRRFVELVHCDAL